MTETSRIANISFLVEAKVHQTLTINDEQLNALDIVEGLSEGRYVTTIHYDSNNESKMEVVEFRPDGTEYPVATIETQSVIAEDGNSSFSHFEVVENDTCCF